MIGAWSEATSDGGGGVCARATPANIANSDRDHNQLKVLF